MLHLATPYHLVRVERVPSPQEMGFSALFVCVFFFQNFLQVNLSALLFENQNTTATVAMEMKYLHEGISN